MARSGVSMHAIHEEPAACSHVLHAPLVSAASSPRAGCTPSAPWSLDRTAAWWTLSLCGPLFPSSPSSPPTVTPAASSLACSARIFLLACAAGSDDHWFGAQVCTRRPVCLPVVRACHQPSPGSLCCVCLRLVGGWLMVRCSRSGTSWVLVGQISVLGLVFWFLSGCVCVFCVSPRLAVLILRFWSALYVSLGMFLSGLFALGALLR